MWCNIFQLVYRAILILHSVAAVQGFSWSAGEASSNVARKMSNSAVSSSAMAQSGSRLPSIYAVAMQELQELESEPLCHRVAARLLVNNCQLLDGKDDATVLIDSGRQIRDFVDSYAASLAICDLERGQFDIPSSCTPFRESTLTMIPDSKVPRLHVSPQQIDSCLSGLARSDSAWNTWVSYRHKALRFCEAARVDNDKAQSVRLHQRLTEVLSKLSDGVERELELHLQAMKTRANQATEHLRSIIPDVDQLRNNLRDVDRIISQEMIHTAQASKLALQDGFENAQNLQQLLSILLGTVLSSNAEVAATYETTISAFKQNAQSQIDAVLSVLASASASSLVMQNRMELSNAGLRGLSVLTENLSLQYETHVRSLTQAQQTSEDLIGKLDKIAQSASDIHGSVNSSSGWRTYVPYLVCPTVSLLMGSYGLPPSASRNLVLITIGEVAGAIVSHTHFFAPQIWGRFSSTAAPHNEKKDTVFLAPANNDIDRDLP
nr:nuclear membrane fusion protein kar5 [Colletotrichum truncatum]KAF6798966.1 nuclear membrane fusion protein kar5 [Colletotrichum truncatum]